MWKKKNPFKIQKRKLEEKFRILINFRNFRLFFFRRRKKENLRIIIVGLYKEKLFNELIDPQFPFLTHFAPHNPHFSLPLLVLLDRKIRER